MTAGEIASCVTIAKPTLSAHFAILRAADLVAADKSERASPALPARIKRVTGDKRQLRWPHFSRRLSFGRRFRVMVFSGNRRWPNVVAYSHRIDCFDTPFRGDGSRAGKITQGLVLDSRPGGAIGAFGAPFAWPSKALIAGKLAGRMFVAGDRHFRAFDAEFLLLHGHLNFR